MNRVVLWIICCALFFTNVSASSSSTDDEQLQHKVRDVLRATDGLTGITAEVSSGVVTLQGEVVVEADSQRAVRIVESLDNVIAVNDQIRVSNSVDARLSPVAERIWERIHEILGWAPLLIVAACVLIVFSLIARMVSRWDALFERMVQNPFLRGLTRTVVAALIVFVGVVIALEVLNATALLGAALGTAGVLGLALGFALRDTIENYIAAVLLSLRQPFAPHDHISVDGYEGQVIRLTSRATILLTFDGNHVRIPNSTVFKGTMVNFSRNHRRRFQFEVGVDTDVDLMAARSLAVETLSRMDSVLEDPEPTAYVTALGDSNVVMLIQGWVDQSQSSYIKVKSEAIRLVKEAFDAADYEMPEPIYRLRVQNVAAHTLEREGRTDPDEVVRAKQQDALALQNTRPSEGDTSRDEGIHRQVAEERRVDATQDLLSSDAATE